MRALAVIAVVGCAAPPLAPTPRESPQQRIETIERDVDRLDTALHAFRPAMCAELGRPVPETPPPEPALSTTSDRLAACDHGDPRGCFWVADGLERGLVAEIDGTTTHTAKDPARAAELFRRSCDAGYRNGCLWLSSLLAKQGDLAGWIALAEDLYTAGRVELSAEIWPHISELEQQRDVEAYVAMRGALEARCDAGNGEACARRGRRECRRDGSCPESELPWQVRACNAGSAFGCGLASSKLDETALDRTEAVLRLRCHGTACERVIEGLGDSCRAGAWSSCYLAANACTRGDSVRPRRRRDRTVDL